MRVLLVEPDPVWAERIAPALTAESAAVEVVTTLVAARAAAARGDWDVLVVASDLPDGSGLSLCHEVGAGVRRLVIAPPGLPHRVAALEAGADDVVSRETLAARAGAAGAGPWTGPPRSRRRLCAAPSGPSASTRRRA
ncbi:MAG: hypothetical protein R3F59_08160 [Myxococcota bacterium]